MVLARRRSQNRGKSWCYTAAASLKDLTVKEKASDRTGRRPHDRHDAVPGPRGGHQFDPPQSRPSGSLHLVAGRARPVGRPHATESRNAGRVHRRARHRSRLDHEDQAADGARNAGADRARAGRREHDRRGHASRRPGRGDARQPQPTAIGRHPRAARAPPRARAVHDALIRTRVSRTAAAFSRGVGRRDHPRTGGHHRRCQSGLARALRLLRRRCAHRHAAHGSVRARYPSRAEGRARGLPAGQVVGPRPQGSGAAVGRIQLAVGSLAHPGGL